LKQIACQIQLEKLEFGGTDRTQTIQGKRRGPVFITSARNGIRYHLGCDDFFARRNFHKLFGFTAGGDEPPAHRPEGPHGVRDMSSLRE
jgi:hypothetical protein